MARRSALAAMAGAVAVAGGGTATAEAAPLTRAAAQEAGGGLPVLAVGADWAEELAANPRVQLVPGATYTLSSTVELPDGCLVVGNGATVTVSGTSLGAFRVSGKRDVTLTGIRFRGQPEDPVGTGMVTAHVGVRVSRSSDVRVHGCDFTHWRGAGVVVTGSADDDFFAYRVKVHDNTFDRCYFGFSAADRSEYALLGNNTFTYCRLAIWNSSGNWTVNGNSVVGCYGAYYSFAATSPYGSLTADNWNHGSVVGNTFNHANSGTPTRWSSNAGFPLGGGSQDPGPGVVVNGVLPPTFSGNTLWYTDVTATGLQGGGWLLTGCALSDLTLSCEGEVPVHLVGVQTHHAPTLKGNVKDLLAGAAG